MSRFTRLSHPALLVLTGLVCLAAPRRVPAAGYAYSLFDGKTLNGWTIENKCKADVDKGKIRLHEGNGWLRSDHQYGDFLLQVEWKAEKETGYDGGIFVRTRPGGDPFPRQGYQLNLADGREGACGRLPGATPPPGLIKRGDWNAFDILVVGNSVSLVINGRPAYRATGLKIDRGHIGIQVEVPGGGRLWFRNLRITELGHHSLFNGRDLSGWEGAGAKADTCWRVRAKKPPVQHSKLWARALKRFRSLGGDLAEISGPDNQYGDESVIECTGKKGPWLRTNRQYGDFNLRFEYQVSPGGNSGIYVRVPESGLHHRDNAQSPPAGFEIQILDDKARKYAKLKDYQYCGSVYDIAGATRHVGRSAGEWNTMEINCVGQHITTIHNGLTIIDITSKSHPLQALRKVRGFLGLQNHSTVVKFRRLRIGPGVAADR